jgi:NAD(P)-dependent dehydrogenase (short-subunit alcohol dehydrogenase family)
MTRNLQGKSRARDRWRLWHPAGLTALAFAREGARGGGGRYRWRTPRNAPSPRSAAMQIAEHLAIACDVTDDDAVKAMIAATVDAFRRP